MPLDELEETPSGRGYGYDGVKHLYCKKKHRISCKVRSDDNDEKEMDGVTLDIETDDGASFRYFGGDISVHFKKEAKCWVESGMIECSQTSPINEYEITLRYTSKEDGLLEPDYGFGINPPIVIHAKSMEEALEHLNLPDNAEVETIKKV